jgi:hypothetical protein
VAGKKGGAIVFALIFFVSFFYQEKKENIRFPKHRNKLSNK